jgi:hypothetical protein
MIQGTDIEVLLELFDSENEPINPETFAAYVITLYAEIQGQKRPMINLSYSEVTEDGLRIIIPRSFTKTAPCAKYYLEFKFKTTAGDEFENGQFAQGVTDLFIGEIKQSVLAKW